MAEQVNRAVSTQWRRAAVGAVAGAAGSLAMHGLVIWWDALTRGRVEQGMFGLDEEANVNSMQKIWPRLNRVDANRIAIGFHYVYGAATGAGYAMAAESVPVMRVGFGTAFGALLWLVGGEVAIAASGVSDPFSKTVGSHVTALGAHLVFGSILELGARLGGTELNEIGVRD